jgi:hypothetical protein
MKFKSKAFLLLAELSMKTMKLHLDLMEFYCRTRSQFWYAIGDAEEAERSAKEIKKFKLIAFPRHTAWIEFNDYLIVRSSKEYENR